MHQGGAKNAVKRVTVSYTDIESAVRAIEAYANNKVCKFLDYFERGGRGYNLGLEILHNLS